jgi:hypothetical protein
MLYFNSFYFFSVVGRCSLRFKLSEANQLGVHQSLQQGSSKFLCLSCKSVKIVGSNSCKIENYCFINLRKNFFFVSFVCALFV